MRRNIKSQQRQMRILAIDLDGTGTAALGEGQYDATLTDNGTGDYTLTFNESFARLPVVVATSLTADVIIQIDNVANDSVDILCFDATDGTTAKDADVHVLIIGSDVVDQVA